MKKQPEQIQYDGGSLSICNNSDRSLSMVKNLMPEFSKKIDANKRASDWCKNRVQKSYANIAKKMPGCLAGKQFEDEFSGWQNN